MGMTTGSRLIWSGLLVLSSFALLLLLGPLALVLAPVVLVLAGVVLLLVGEGDSGGAPERVNCANCGAPNPPDADACKHCGEPL